MSDPESNTRFEEMAALHAVGLLDETAQKELLEAAQRDIEIGRIVRDFAGTAALLVYEAPEIEPPSGLRREILRRLPARGAASNLVPFSPWLPYAIAACLMLLGIALGFEVLGLKSELRSLNAQFVAASADATRLRESNALLGLRLATLETKEAVKDASYASSKITVAWDPYQHRGVVALQNLPTPPAGRDYQLWVLDPAAPAPLSAGLISGARSFSVKPVSTPSPGFALSLEPAGGSLEPTGPILFAVAPGP